MTDRETMAFYASNAEAFSDSRLPLNMSEDYLPFLAEIPESGHILDAGCGHGRDARAFCQRGYRVTPLDASEELVANATQVTGLPVQHRAFEAIDEIDQYDGIWASASLLHLTKPDLIATLPRLQRALKQGGVLYLSVREGVGTYRDNDGRFFNDYEEAELRTVLEECPGWSLLSLRKRPDRGGRPITWLQALARRRLGTRIAD